MKFYIPCTADREEAEILWDHVRADLRAMGLATSHRRIRALTLHNAGCDHVLHIGGETPDGELVLLILEARDAELFYVCTPFRGVLEGLPFPLGLNAQSRAIDFEEDEMVGWG